MKKHLYIISSIVLFALSTTHVFAQSNKLRNVIVILADDHALNVTGTYGNTLIKTPSIDKLSTEGLTFNNAYCASPICSASRQSLLTGKYPHATGVSLLFTPFPDEGNITIAEHLTKFDYKTALIGKHHFNNWVWNDLYKDGTPKHGFDTIIGGGSYKTFYKHANKKALPKGKEFYKKKHAKNNVAESMNCRVLPHPVYDNHSRGTFYANETINFIEENKDNPFFIWLAFNEPHHPYYFPIEYEGKYNPDDMPLPKGSKEDDRWVPEKYKKLTDDEKRGIIASYYTSTEYMDKNIGIVTSALEKMNIAENTLIIYISDNGYLLNDHKRFEKHTMWEESINQPMIVKGGNNSRFIGTTNALVEYIDIVPTILDLINIEPLNEAQGESFVSVLKGKDIFKEYIFSEYLEDNLAMILNNKWKYVFTTGSRDLGIGYKTGNGPSGIVHRLYSRENDPNETKSLANDPKYSEILLSMKNAMLNRFIETHPDAKNCPSTLTLEGKLAWFCEPRDIGASQSLEVTPIRVFSN